MADQVLGVAVVKDGQDLCQWHDCGPIRVVQITAEDAGTKVISGYNFRN